MASITTRAGKGSPLTHAEVDANFNNLNSGKLDISTAPAGSITVDSSGRMGLGTSSPQKELQITAVTPTIRLEESSASAKRLELSVNSAAEALISAPQSSSQLLFAASGSERARIDSSGRLLVGTSTAFDTSILATVYGAGIEGNGQFAGIAVKTNKNSVESAYLVLGKSRGATGNSKTIVQSGDGLGFISFEGADGANMLQAATIVAQVDGTPGANDMPGRLVFSTTADGASSPTERMMIANDGQTSLFGSGNIAAVISSAKAAGTTDYIIQGRYSASGNTGGITSFQIFTNGNTQNTNNSYAGISDVKLKENIIDANSQWADIKALQVRNYNFKEGQTHTQIGLVAQEVELVSPGLVTESPDRDEDGNDLGTVTKSVNYSVLYMKAVKALQEAMERIETIEAKVAALEASS